MSFELQPLSVEMMFLIGRAVFLVFTFVVAAYAFTRWRRAAELDTQRVLAQMAEIKEQIGGLEAGLAAVDGRLGLLTQRLETELRAAPAAGNSAPSYQIAIRLARSGATHEELMEACGVTRQEAELMQRLHGSAKRAARTAVA